MKFTPLACSIVSCRSNTAALDTCAVHDGWSIALPFLYLRSVDKTFLGPPFPGSRVSTPTKETLVPG
jgi:hypothetical protein